MNSRQLKMQKIQTMRPPEQIEALKLARKTTNANFTPDDGVAPRA